MIAIVLSTLLAALAVYILAECTAKPAPVKAEYPDPANPFRKGAQ